MTIKEILLANISEAVPADDIYQPTDGLLDEIWEHLALEAMDNKALGMLMSDVLNGDEVVDRLQVSFAANGSLELASALRVRLQELFRTWAYNMAEKYEADVMEAYWAAPECAEEGQ